VTLRLTGERTLPGIPRENYWFRRHVAAYRFAATVVRGRVVDAGAGEGYGSALLAGRAGSVLALDLDAVAVRHAARRYPAARHVQADLCRLPLADGAVDGIVALQVLEHLPCAEGFLDTCRHALRRGGRLVLSTPNRATFPSGRNPWHEREYDDAELGALLRSRFEDVRLIGVGHGAVLRAVDRALGEPVQHRLVREPYEALPRWLRGALRAVRARAFVVGADALSSLDLLAVCGYG
jgi:SAM-dependent methyltransferase